MYLMNLEQNPHRLGHRQGELVRAEEDLHGVQSHERKSRDRGQEVGGFLMNALPGAF